MNINIYSDNRERAVLDHLDVCSSQERMFKKNKDLMITIERKQLLQGDYIIGTDGKYLAIIERKTLSDYAESIKDGRIDNIEKMKEFTQNNPGCKMYIIVEGQVHTSPNKEFKGIPFKNILANIDHLSYRENISIIWTVNELHTAQRLCQLAENIFPILVELGGSDDSIDSSIIKSRNKQNEFNRQLMKLWTSLPGVGYKKALAYSKLHSFQDYLVNNHNPEMLIGKLAIDIWSALPGISKKSAERIAPVFNIYDFIKEPIEIKIANSTAIGKTKLKNIITLLEYKQ